MTQIPLTVNAMCPSHGPVVQASLTELLRSYQYDPEPPLQRAVCHMPANYAVHHACRYLSLCNAQNASMWCCPPNRLRLRLSSCRLSSPAKEEHGSCLHNVGGMKIFAALFDSDKFM